MIYTGSMLTIDPGVTPGWAFWRKSCNRPADVGRITPPDRDWLGKTEWVTSKLKLLIQQYNPSRVVCEFPEFFESDGGQLSARSGALVKLVFAVGRIAGMCDAVGYRFVPIEVHVWKGQMPKPAVIHRIQRILKVGSDFAHKDEWDAIGIGLHVRNIFI